MANLINGHEKRVVIPRLKVGNDSSFVIGKLFFSHQKVLKKKLQHPNIKDTSPFFCAILKSFTTISNQKFQG